MSAIGSSDKSNPDSSKTNFLNQLLRIGLWEERASGSIALTVGNNPIQPSKYINFALENNTPLTGFQAWLLKNDIGFKIEPAPETWKGITVTLCFTPENAEKIWQAVVNKKLTISDIMTPNGSSLSR